MASQRSELLINEQETNIDEVDYLLSSPRTTVCVPSRVVSAVYGSADFQTSPLTLRGAGGKNGDGAPYQLRAREGVEGPKDFMSGCDSYFPRMAESIKNLRGLNVLKYLKRARDASLGMQGVILL